MKETMSIHLLISLLLAVFVIIVSGASWAKKNKSKSNNQDK